MRLLKYSLYNGGNVGLFNNLMSLELAVGLSISSNRRLLMNVPEFPIYNSESKKNLFDLVELSLPHEKGNFAALQGELLPDLHSTRISSFDLHQFDHAKVLATRNENTLGYYSYVLPFDERIVYACDRLITVKEPYRRAALSIVGDLRRKHGRFASVHIRRTDFLADHDQTQVVSLEDLLHNLSCHVPPDCLLLIHSDETDRDYFQPILAAYPNHWLIDESLFRCLYPGTLDSAEIGLVSAIVASYSDIFLGTMFSTFTGYIQRKRLLNGKNGGFLYLYNQRPDGLGFQDGRILETGASGYTWDKIDMPEDLRSICFWWREWPESVFRPANGDG
jgi:hypothetical protein